MSHKLNLETAKIYGNLLNMVDPNCHRLFAKRFEEFLDAYDGGSKPVKSQTTENSQRKVAEQRQIPDAGKVYKNEFGIFYRALDVISDESGCFVVLRTLPKFFTDDVREAVLFMTLNEFQKMELKECTE